MNSFEFTVRKFAMSRNVSAQFQPTPHNNFNYEERFIILLGEAFVMDTAMASGTITEKKLGSAQE